MSGSINTAASGLDQLNSARRVVSGGKDTVYDSIDRALAATGPLTASMEPMAGHLAAAQEALTQTVDILGEMNGQSRLVIYPTIHVVLMGDDVRALIETYEEGEEEDDEPEV